MIDQLKVHVPNWSLTIFAELRILLGYVTGADQAFGTDFLQGVHNMVQKKMTAEQPELLRLSYEDFVVSPATTQIVRILQFCKFADDHACFRYVRSKAIYKRNKANEESFKADKLRKIQRIRNTPNGVKEVTTSGS